MEWTIKFVYCIQHIKFVLAAFIPFHSSKEIPLLQVRCIEQCPFNLLDMNVTLNPYRRGAPTNMAHMKMSAGGKRILPLKVQANLLVGSTQAMEGVPTSDNVHFCTSASSYTGVRFSLLYVHGTSMCQYLSCVNPWLRS